MTSFRILYAGLLAISLGAWAVPAFAQDKKVASKQSVTKDQATRKYREGVALERKGDDRAALAAFLEAGEAGNGLAQKKLATIYDRGNAAVPRDYQSAILWYEKARSQGIELAKPIPPIKGR